MLKWYELVQLTDEQLARLDVAKVHLACAEGLPGSESINHDACIRRIDEVTEWVRSWTERVFAAGKAKEAGETPAKARIRCLGTVVWQKAGIRYNPAKIPDDAPWEFQDSFIHGALFGPGGTCATLPIIYAAIGRRLGYPLKLATAWGPKWCHLFCRWDDPRGERFNIGVNDTGVSFPTDDDYRRRGVQSAVYERRGRFLQSMTPRQELGEFLAERALHWRNAGNVRQATETFAWAASLTPGNEFTLNTLYQCYDRWLEELKRREPPRFPSIYIRLLRRRFPDALPREVEQDMTCLAVKEDLLNDEEAEARWWAPLRRGDYGVWTPREIDLEAVPGQVTIKFS